MPTTQFDRDSMARWYAKQHLNTDPGIEAVHYLPNDAGDREIRLIEINTLIADRADAALEPIDFGIDTGTDNEHQLKVVDVTQDQWARLLSGELELPRGWSIDGEIAYAK